MEVDREMADVLLTMLVTVLFLIAITGWALVSYLIVVLERKVDRIRGDIGELDRDIGNLWQVTFPPKDGRPMVPAEILPFIKRPPA